MFSSRPIWPHQCRPRSLQKKITTLASSNIHPSKKLYKKSSYFVLLSADLPTACHHILSSDKPCFIPAPLEIASADEKIELANYKLSQISSGWINEKWPWMNVESKGQAARSRR